MVGRQNGDFGDGMEIMCSDHCGKPLAFLVGRPDESGVTLLVGDIDGQHVVAVVQADIVFTVLFRPIGQFLA